MTALSAITIRPDLAARAYRNVDQGSATDGAADGTAGAGGAGGMPDFGAVLGRALQGVVADGHVAESQAMSAIAGGADLTAAVTALSKADLALQTTMAVRDRVVQAYQDIMKMPI